MLARPWTYIRPQLVGPTCHQQSSKTMCRWFAYISATESCLLEDVLIEPKHSISKQVHSRYLPGLSEYEPDATKAATKAESNLRNSPYNMDGLGIGWWAYVTPLLLYINVNG